MPISLIIPSFIAGLLTFLAPCTLPLVPGFLGFISGVSLEDLKDPENFSQTRHKIFRNGLLYVAGFSIVFILLGSLFGLGGASLIKYRIWLSRIGGIFVVFFGLYMLGVLPSQVFYFFSRERRFFLDLKPGRPISSLIFGATFAFGWTPCVGPILGAVLLLASNSASVFQGAFLLFIFSLGLAIPFLLVAAGISSAAKYLRKISRYLRVVSIVGGVFLVFLGIFLATNKFPAWLSFAYRIFDFINYDRLLNHL